MSSTNRGATRNPNDFYPTPAWCVDCITERLAPMSGLRMFEPCKGSGVIYDHPAFANCDHRGWAELSEGRDYFDAPIDHDRAHLIITNPPFSLAEEFLRRSLRSSATVVYLLRLNFLGSAKRLHFWRTYEPTHIYVHSQRPDFTGGGGDSCEYAWFVWERAGLMRDKPGVYHLWSQAHAASKSRKGGA